MGNLTADNITGINLKLFDIIDNAVKGMVYLIKTGLLYYKSKILK